MNDSIPAPFPAARFWPRVGWTVLALGATLAAANAVLFMTAGAGDPQIRERFFATALAGWVHSMGGALAALIGPFQLWPPARARWPRAHAALGRVYLVAVTASGLAGLYFAQTSVGGPAGSLGFGALGVCWLTSAALAFVAIRRRDTRAHRRWMLRNYALTFAAFTLRVQLPALLAAGLSIHAGLAIVAWTSWIPNLVAVELWLQRDALRLAARARSPAARS